MNIYEAIINFFRLNKDSKLKEESDNLVDRMQIDTLKEKWFHYNPELEQWERVWTVATLDSAERSKEVYKKEGDKWRVIMYGNTGEVFFEHNIEEEYDYRWKIQTPSECF